MKILSDVQSYLNKLRDKWAGSSISLQLITAATILIILAIIAVWTIDKIFIYVVARSYVEDIAYVFNLNKNLSQAIALAVFLLGVYFVGRVFSFSRSGRRAGYLGIIALLIGHSLFLWYGTSGQFFDEREGEAKATKCYVLTRDGKVRYRELGRVIDPETGLQCRDVTPAMLERLKEYEAGKKPAQISDEQEPVFFDTRTGEPIIWFWTSKAGEIKIFNLMGFNPDNGDELKPITGDVVEAYKVQVDKHQKELERLSRPPHEIDPNTYSFFDSATGKPQVWYWRGVNGEYEFYDNQGFHPITGDELKIVDRVVIAAWKQYILDKKKEQLRREQDQKDRQERERQQQLQQQRDQERAQQLEQERKQKEAQEQAEQQQRQAQSGALCDQAASNPNDRQKPSNVPGVPYEEINVSEALEACRTAIGTFPGELRYRYQYARALESSDPSQSIRIYAQLTRQKYAASFDNLGSLLLKHNDRSGAIAAFKNGAQVDDPDSLVSLADLIERGIVRVPNPDANRYALLARAAQLGHQGAQRAVEEQKQIMQQNQIQQQNRLQQEQLMFQMFKGVLGGALGH